MIGTIYMLRCKGSTASFHSEVSEFSSYEKIKKYTPQILSFRTQNHFFMIAFLSKMLRAHFYNKALILLLRFQFMDLPTRQQDRCQWCAKMWRASFHSELNPICKVELTGSSTSCQPKVRLSILFKKHHLTKPKKQSRRNGYMQIYQSHRLDQL